MRQQRETRRVRHWATPLALVFVGRLKAGSVDLDALSDIGSQQVVVVVVVGGRVKYYIQVALYRAGPDRDRPVQHCNLISIECSVSVALADGRTLKLHEYKLSKLFIECALGGKIDERRTWTNL
jgi:hypothetical protein